MGQTTNRESGIGSPGEGPTDAFITRVRAEFDSMKKPSPKGGHRELRDASNPSVRLVPVTSDAVTEALITELATWRDRHQYAFGTRFPVTLAGTEKWLRCAVLDNPDRLLFLVVGPSDQRLGNIGLLLSPREGHRIVELDNVLRGRAGVPGAMRVATRLVEDWAYDSLGAKRILLRVLASNSRAIRFYAQLGYEPCDHIPLTEQRLGDRTELARAERSDPVVDEYLVMKKDSSDRLEAGARPKGPISDRRSPGRALHLPERSPAPVSIDETPDD